MDALAPNLGRAPDTIRLASYNVEWFNGLFDDTGRLYNDDAPSARHQISRRMQSQALGLVFQALDADGIMIIEGPDTNSRRSTIKALEYFAALHGLRANKALHGFSSETEQEIAFLYDPTRLQAEHDPKGAPTGRRGPRPPGTISPRFDGTFRYDLDTDHVEDTIRFSKPPLEIALTLPDAQSLRLIGVHAKSKNPHGAHDEASAMRISIENRRKQLAQCIWLRARVEEHLACDEDVIVLGDFNDGPGLDEFEKLFGKSGVEIVLGTEAEPELRLTDPNANLALCNRMGFAPTSARFWLAPQARYFEALLDFIMISRGLRHRAPKWRIWHPLNDPKITKNHALSEALLQASDHFPVTLDLALKS